jgi:hypothetical protein
MTFEQAVAQAQPPVNGAYQPGLQALGSNCDLVHCSTPRSITGSIYVDGVLAAEFPNSPRWDYGVGFRRTSAEEAVWIEVHPAATSDVRKMIDKLNWLQKWLERGASALNALTLRAERPFHWIATGGVHINRNSPQARRLAQSGLRYPVQRLELH